MCQERYNYRGMNVEFIQRTIEGYGRVEDVIVDGEKLTQIAVSYLRDGRGRWGHCLHFFGGPADGCTKTIKTCTLADTPREVKVRCLREVLRKKNIRL